jgi:uncharacterized protein YciI
MAAYLFQLELPELTNSIMAVIPIHRAHINKLSAEGRVLSYSVSAARSMIWCVVNAEDEQEAMEMILSFPMYPHFTDITCHPLLFHNTIPAFMPGISLN